MRTHRNVQKSQAGFTLIELVMVIVILGVLAATALPKFVDLASEARSSVMQGVQASMQAANTMIYAKAAANNKLATSGATMFVTINGTQVDTHFGYAKDLTELMDAITLSPTSDFLTTATATGGTVDHTGGTSPNCRITYAQATQAGGVTTPPSYATTYSGC